MMVAGHPERNLSIQESVRAAKAARKRMPGRVGLVRVRGCGKPRSTGT